MFLGNKKISSTNGSQKSTNGSRGTVCHKNRVEHEVIMIQSLYIWINMQTRIITRIFFLLAWLGMFLLLCWSYANFFSLPESAAKSAGIIAIFMLVFYVNSKYLVNFFLEKKKHLLYYSSAIVLLFLAVILRVGLDKLYPHIQLPLQAFMAGRRPYAGPFLIMFFWICLSLFYQLLVNRYDREKKYREEINSFIISQNEFLKGQINPHFLFNNLNNIYSLIQIGSPKAGEMVLKLSEILRYSVYRNGQDKVPVHEELEQIRNLVGLYNLKEGHPLNINVKEEIHEKVMIEPMLLIPLVENCFKHGNPGQSPNAFIDIHCTASAEIFEFTVKNSFIPGTGNQKGGVGLANIKKRLALLYGNNAGLSTSKNNDVFTAQIQVKWQRN